MKRDGELVNKRLTMNHSDLFINAMSAQLIFILVVASAGTKRKRTVDGRNPNKHRNRAGIMAEIMSLDDRYFLRMMRMPKNLFIYLATEIAPHLRGTWRQRSPRMAVVSSGSVVETGILLVATIRWLAGGSVYDIAFMLKLSDRTVHARKYDVMRAINVILKGS